MSSSLCARTKLGHDVRTSHQVLPTGTKSHNCVHLGQVWAVISRQRFNWIRNSVQFLERAIWVLIFSPFYTVASGPRISVQTQPTVVHAFHRWVFSFCCRVKVALSWCMGMHKCLYLCMYYYSSNIMSSKTTVAVGRVTSHFKLPHHLMDFHVFVICFLLVIRNWLFVLTSPQHLTTHSFLDCKHVLALMLLQSAGFAHISQVEVNMLKLVLVPLT